jgi:hypothetical protein
MVDLDDIWVDLQSMEVWCSLRQELFNLIALKPY